MGSIYYVDPDAVGNDDGTSQANAWTSLQRAIDGTDGTPPAAGDIVKCKHGTGVDETLSASIDVDGNSGDESSGLIQFVGVNSSWVEDGTRYVIDGNDTATNCLTFNNVGYVWFRNFEFLQAADDGINSGGTAVGSVIFDNCISHDNGSDGMYGYNFSAGSQIIRCSFYNNIGNGLFGFRGTVAAFSSFHTNGDCGIEVSNAGIPAIYGCLIYDNTDDGVSTLRVGGALINCVIDSNDDDGILARSASGAQTNIILGCRITNHSGAGDIGLNANSELLLYGWCYFEDNDGDNIQNGTLAYPILVNGADTNDEDNADTNEGYVGSGDYDLNYVDGTDPTLFSTGIVIPTSA